MLPASRAISYVTSAINILNGSDDQLTYLLGCLKATCPTVVLQRLLVYDAKLTVFAFLCTTPCIISHRSAAVTQICIL